MKEIRFNKDGSVNTILMDKGEKNLTKQEIENIKLNGELEWKMLKNKRKLYQKQQIENYNKKKQKLEMMLKSQKDRMYYTCFMTFNPHITNLKEEDLQFKFRLSLMKYYQSKYGKDYVKYKSKQYMLGIFHHLYNIKNKKLLTFIQNHLNGEWLLDTNIHLHILGMVETEEINNMYEYILKRLKKTYQDITGCLVYLDTDPVKQYDVFKYCDREENNIITTSVLIEPKEKNNDF